jgi:hypothetical protein
MTDQQHRATPEQWANMEEYRDDGYDDGYASCILELHDRIAALEAGQTCPHIVSSDEGTSYCALAEQTANQFRDAAEMVAPSAPADSLVVRVAKEIAEQSLREGDPSWAYLRPEARAAIREVAAWLDTKGQHGCSLWMREEAER